MAEEIRNRRFNTEMENLERIDSSKIQVDRKPNYLNNGTVLSISFNLKDHAYNPRLLKDSSQSIILPEGEEDDESENKVADENEDEEENGDPIDEFEDKQYIFDLIVPGKFPFMFPELRARCDFCKPSLLDERDLMEDMLGKQWHPFIILKDIIEKIPQYVYKIKKREKDGTLYYDCLSNYTLNAFYDLLKFKDNQEVCKSFACGIADGDELTLVRKKKRNEEIKRLQEDAKRIEQNANSDHQDAIEHVEDERYKKYIVIVSDNSLLLFERPPYEDKKEDENTGLEVDQSDFTFTTGKLILWGSITSIEQLKRNMEFRDKISIVWSKPVKNEDDFHFEYDGEDEKELEDELDLIYETTIEVPNPDDFMIVVLDKMNAIKETTNQLKKNKILSMEVTSESIKTK